MLRKIALAVALALPALPAFAAAEGFVDGYYIPSDQIKAANTGDSVSGNGLGAHVHFPLASVFLITAEYQHETFDEIHLGGASGDIDDSNDELRVGFGLQSTPDVLRGTVYADYIRLMPKQGDDRDGFGLHARVSFTPPPLKELNAFAEIGYVRIESNGETFDGPEFLVGAAWKVWNELAVFADYRITRFDGNGGTTDGLRFYDLRTGVRFYFQPGL